MSNRIPQDAFSFYFGLGAGRSYGAVAQHFGVSKQAVAKVAQREKWAAQIQQVEAKAHANTTQKMVETLEAMNDRHLKMLQAIQRKALEALRAIPLESAMSAVRALDICIRQERTIRGEPTDRTAIDVEQVIKREYERWMVRDDGAAKTNGDHGE